MDFAESGVRFSVGGYLVFQRMKPLVQPNGADEVTAIAEPSQHPLLFRVAAIGLRRSKPSKKPILDALKLCRSENTETTQKILRRKRLNTLNQDRTFSQEIVRLR